MLTRERRRTEFPDDVACLAVDAYDGRSRPVTGEDVTVRQFQDAITHCPQRPKRLDLGDAVRDRIKMLPTAPLPDGLSRRSQFSQIVSLHLASVPLRLRSVEGRGQTMVFRPPFDLPSNFGRNRAQTIQQHVSVAQQDPDVMVVWVA